MMNYSFPSDDNFIETIETFSEDAYIFCAPETIDQDNVLKTILKIPTKNRKYILMLLSIFILKIFNTLNHYFETFSINNLTFVPFKSTSDALSFNLT